jgi:hypothetical protein
LFPYNRTPAWPLAEPDLVGSVRFRSARLGSALVEFLMMSFVSFILLAIIMLAVCVCDRLFSVVFFTAFADLVRFSLLFQVGNLFAFAGTNFD